MVIGCLQATVDAHAGGMSRGSKSYIGLAGFFDLAL
jgi:hypothetical protein